MFSGFLGCSAAYCLLVIIVSSTMRRSALTESLMRKFADDEKHKTDRHTYWYEIDTARLSDDVKDKFVQLDQDSETAEFLENCYEKSDAFLWQLWHSVAVPFLKLFMTQTNVNGYLNRGSMFVYSTAQFRRLLGVAESWRAGSLLDLGAGDGKVTEKMAAHFGRVFATEVSTQMQKHLLAKNYTLLGIDDWLSRKYDVISCLNLLDRCDKPMSLLRDIRASLEPGGSVVVASVYPYSPYVETNSTDDYRPTERLNISASCMEEQVNQMVADVFRPAGFSLHSFSRVPYLCEGDLTTSFYVLYDIIFVLKAVADEGVAST